MNPEHDLSSPRCCQQKCCERLPRLRILYQRCLGLAATTVVGFVEFALVKHLFEGGDLWTAALAVSVAGAVWFCSQVMINSLQDG